ncbi:MAG TPA: sigma-54-dependent Fis family transcriptional regulator [Firmicutes bacterium]|nr:sigma-54-dependent Fis family transcriptional regulator [Bacillota bacterium]
MKNARFLVVDDEPEVCNFFAYLLKSKGGQVESAHSGTEARARLGQCKFNVALVDLKLPDSDGLEILKEIKLTQPECEVIIITGYSTVKSAVEAIQLGAFDYVEKPFADIEEMESLLEKALSAKLEADKLAAQEEYGFVVGRNPKMISLVTAARKIAKKNITVLIQGETGTGKEVLARYIHSVSHRSERPFLGFNCGAFTETLLESELFGHEKGAFTGATSRKKGIFELAHKGTLFLDEIDSASQAIQIKLLRILETGELLRVGGEEICKVDVRIITATNADLATKVEERTFREDLFYRLDVASLVIPPLRERAEDIPLFVNYFLEKESKLKGTPKRFAEQAMDLLVKHSWPGNIRELANTVAQAVLLSKGPNITVADLPPKLQPPPKVVSPSKNGPARTSPEKLPEGPRRWADHPRQIELSELSRQWEKLFLELDLRKGFNFTGFQADLKQWNHQLLCAVIKLALKTTFGNQAKAAELLGITPRALRYYLKERQP